MTSAALDLNFNITIKILDKSGHLIETRHVHNRATRALVGGITQFLQGVFNPSEFNDPYEKYSNPEEIIINNALSAKRYIPSCTGVGTCGMSVSDLENHELVIDKSQQIKPHFYETSLQIEIPDVPRVKFKRARATTGVDQNNAQNLVLTTVLPKGYLVLEYEDGEAAHDETGKVIYRDNYFDYYGDTGESPTPVHAMAITEIGLFSNTDKDSGLLLARVLLDGELSDDPVKAKRGVMKNPDYQYNPLIQTEDTSVVIEWRIGIISIGTNDEFIVESDQDPDVPIEDHTPSGGEYEGPYRSKSLFGPDSSSDRVYPTADKVMTQDFTVEHIQYNDVVDSESGGRTVSIDS